MKTWLIALAVMESVTGSFGARAEVLATAGSAPTVLTGTV